MFTTYAAAVSLADSMYITPTNPHGWVPGFDKEPAKFLQDVAQPYADAGIKLMLHNAFGRGGKSRTFSKRFDGQAASVTAAEWMPDEQNAQFFALSNFIKSPGMEGTFLYIGAPEVFRKVLLQAAAERLEHFRYRFPGCIPIYDNTGDIDSSELCAGSALFAAHDAMARPPFNSPVPWGIEPNPANHSTVSPLVPFTPKYVYGTPLTWSAKSRFSLGTMAQVTTPIVAIRGDDFKTPAERLAVAREWGPKVAPYNGIVVVHGVSVAQMAGLTR
jgi:hypothetical protein